MEILRLIIWMGEMTTYPCRPAPVERRLRVLAGKNYNTGEEKGQERQTGGKS